MTLQQTIEKLNNFWSKQGCLIAQSYGLEVGAGTSNPHTFFRVLGQEPFNVAYVEPSRRPDDGRYGLSPYRFQHFFQYQIILKPAPLFNQELYLKMLKELGIDQTKHDIRFVEDNWQSKPLGAWGLGWEVWCDGMEISQYTYFQQMAGIPLKTPSLEITLGLERLAMYSQDVDDYHNLMWNETVTYSDLFAEHEHWQSKYGFEEANINNATQRYNLYEQEVQVLLKKGNYWAAYDYVLKLSHTFNILDARGAVSLADRVTKFTQMGKYSKQIAHLYLAERKQLQFPLQKKIPNITVILPKKTFPLIESKTIQNQYVLEIGFEEMPANFVAKWVKSLPTDWLDQQLKVYSWTYKNAQFYFTARRIVLFINNPASEITNKITRKGPLQQIAYSNERSAPALKGWLKKNNATETQVIIVTEKGRNFVTLQQEKTVTLAEVMQKIASDLLKTAPQQKIMRWDTSNNSFIRPLRWILSLHNNKTLPLKLFDVIASNSTYPPRYLKAVQVKIPSTKTYFAYLKQANIMIDHRDRSKKLEEILQQQSGTPSPHLAQYLEENVYLNEAIEVKFVKLPKEYNLLPKRIITTILEKNQRYLVIYTPQGIKFGIVSGNINQNPQIKEGNLTATYGRLDDGLFYLKQDLNTKLADRRKDLKKINFHPKLGSFYDKTQRLNKLVKQIYAQFLKQNLPDNLATALLLIKNDKASHLGQEYAKLEGIIGRNYALRENYPDQVAELLEDHYYPNVNQSRLPLTLEGQVLSLTDKLDSLTQLAQVAGLPEGSHDPYQIRQLTYQIILLLTQSNLLSINFFKLLDIFVTKKTLLTKLEAFMQKRLQLYFKDFTNIGWLIKGVVFAKGGDLHQKWTFIQKLSKLSADEQDKIYEMMKRMHNILLDFPQKAALELDKNINLNNIEQQLLKSINATIRFSGSAKRLNIAQFTHLTVLLDEYFNSTIINDPNLKVKNNRLTLLKMIEKSMQFYLIYLPN